MQHALLHASMAQAGHFQAPARCAFYQELHLHTCAPPTAAASYAPLPAAPNKRTVPREEAMMTRAQYSGSAPVVVFTP